MFNQSSAEQHRREMGVAIGQCSVIKAETFLLVCKVDSLCYLAICCFFFFFFLLNLTSSLISQLDLSAAWLWVKCWVASVRLVCSHAL